MTERSGPRRGTDVLQPGPAAVETGARLLASEAPRLRNAVNRVAAEHDLVELDVRGVRVFDAAGLGLLLGLHRLARQNGAALVVVGPPVRLMQALRRRGMHRVLVVEVALPDGAGPAGPPEAVEDLSDDDEAVEPG